MAVRHGSPDGATSSMWTASIVASAVLALLLGTVSAVMAVRSLRPIGEGELLATDAAAAAGVAGSTDAASGESVLRRLRNDLEIEAVALVAEDGVVLTGTSSPLRGAAIHPLLASAMGDGRFAAIAGPVPADVLLDGVLEWPAGTVLYQAVQPLPDGRGVLLLYDLSEMLERRAAVSRLPGAVIPLAVGSGAALLLTGALAAARTRAIRTRREMLIEAGYLRRRATDLQRHNRELEAARAETQRALALAEEKNRIRAEFVLMINHELRTPLTGVVTGARLLAAGDGLAGGDREVLEAILQDGERLERLINQMLAVARVENRGLTVRPEDLAVRDLVGRLGSAHRRARLVAHDDLDDGPGRVRTDLTTLSQLVASLVDNAYTHGASEVRVELTGRGLDEPMLVVGTPPESAVRVRIVDDGPGIDRLFLPRAFEKFEKDSRSSGTGLGLYLARMMAEAIGASIAVQTSPRGTVMELALPAVPVEVAA